MLYETICFDRFVERFKAIRPDNFSHEGLRALFDYLSDFEEDIELDVIAVCCDYTEATIPELHDSYFREEDPTKDAMLESLAYSTGFVQELDNGSVLFEAF